MEATITLGPQKCHLTRRKEVPETSVEWWRPADAKDLFLIDLLWICMANGVCRLQQFLIHVPELKGRPLFMGHIMDTGLLTASCSALACGQSTELGGV